MLKKSLLILLLFPLVGHAQVVFEGTQAEMDNQRAALQASQEIRVRPANFPRVFTERPEPPNRSELPKLSTNLQLLPISESPVFDAEYMKKQAEYDVEMAAVLSERIVYLKNERQKGKESEHGGTFSELEKKQKEKVESLQAKKQALKALKTEKQGK